MEVLGLRATLSWGLLSLQDLWSAKVVVRSVLRWVLLLLLGTLKNLRRSMLVLLRLRWRSRSTTKSQHIL